jgi:2'-5' RNA ligase
MATMTATVRTFIALPVAAEIKEALAGISRRLDHNIAPRAVRWVKPAGMHLTLRFLGDTAVPLLPHIRQALDEIKAAPFTLQLGRLGAFPQQKRPRVIWIGLQGAEQSLLELQQAVAGALTPLGWEPERRPFHPHLTLGRVKNIGGVRHLEWELDGPALRWQVTAVQLIQSDLLPAGPAYTTLHTHLLPAS